MGLHPKIDAVSHPKQSDMGRKLTLCTLPLFVAISMIVYVYLSLSETVFLKMNPFCVHSYRECIEPQLWFLQ